MLQVVGVYRAGSESRIVISRMALPDWSVSALSNILPTTTPASMTMQADEKPVPALLQSVCNRLPAVVDRAENNAQPFAGGFEPNGVSSEGHLENGVRVCPTDPHRENNACAILLK
jgi:hypothetical protein